MTEEGLQVGNQEKTEMDSDLINRYMDYISTVRRYSRRTAEIYMSSLEEFRAFSTQHIAVYDGVTETLAKLKKAGKKLYILSNAQACFTAPEIARLGLKKYFNGIVYSSDYGCAKPDPKFFDVLFKKYNLNKKETVYIGNDKLANGRVGKIAQIDMPKENVKRFIKFRLDLSKAPDASSTGAFDIIPVPGAAVGL